MNTSRPQPSHGDSGKADAAGPPILRWHVDTSAPYADTFSAPKPIGRPSYERDDAACWLVKALAVGARPFTNVDNEAAAHGFRLITARRAFRDMGGEAVRPGIGPLGHWYWRLPSIGDQNPEPTLDHLWANTEGPTRKPEPQDSIIDGDSPRNETQIASGP